MQRPVSSSPCSARRGLAPLELVMSLPILLFTMGLMIIFGTAGAWKVRAQTNSRHAVWRDLTQRSGGSDPNPRNWPANDATMNVHNRNTEIIEEDPYEGYEVVRGPTVGDTQGGGQPIQVDEDKLDWGQGTRYGLARIDRQYPVMASLGDGRMNIPREHELLDGTRFQYSTMGYGSNISRRIPLLYLIDIQGTAAELTTRFLQLAIEIVFNPRKEQLTPLEGGDPEIYELFGERSPDFQPHINVGVEMATISALRGRLLRPRIVQFDPQVIEQTLINPPGQQPGHRDRIRQVPQRMKNYYIQQYERKIRELENADPQPPGAAALIAELKQKVEQLQQFNAQLPPPTP